MSSNIVGYEKISLSTGYNMLGVQFRKVGGQALDLPTVGKLDDTMSGFNEDEEFATLLKVWNGNGYDQYGWAGTSGTDVYDDASYDYKWLDFDTMEPLDNEKAPASLGFWVNAEKAGTMTISGEVPTNATVTVQLAADYNMVANPYPINAPISSFGTLDASMAGFNEDEEFATLLKVWNGNGYDQYGWAGTSGTDVYDDDSYDYKWLDFDTMEPPEDSVTIPYGHAVWIKAEKAGTITFTNPSSAE